MGFELLLLSFTARAPAAQVGFSRITHGWTNYSTAFDATIDPDEFGLGGASVAGFYTPTNHVLPADYGVIVVWRGTGGHVRLAARR